MYKLTKTKFNNFPLSNKSMIYLMWIYSFWQFIAALFINIYIFKIDNDITNVIIYNIIFFSSNLLWFSGLGYILSIYKINIRTMYYLSYIVFILSFIFLLLFKNNIVWSYIFWFIYGTGLGSFWCAVHANELNNIADENRDFYSSLISAGWNILQIITPLLVSVVFYFSSLFSINWYYLLFIIIPIVYLISFLFIKNTWLYIPSKINKDDVKNFFNLKKYFWWQAYIFFTGMLWAFKIVILPIIAIILLKNEVNVWIFESIMWVISFFLVIFLSHIRNAKNRLIILFWVTLVIFLVHLLFSFSFNIYTYILFNLSLVILSPIFRVSEHVYDLKIMDTIKNPDSDFFPSMVLREFTLAISRISTLILCLFLVYYSNYSLETLLKIFLILNGLSYLLVYISIKLHFKYENHNNLENLH